MTQVYLIIIRTFNCVQIKFKYLKINLNKFVQQEMIKMYTKYNFHNT